MNSQPCIAVASGFWQRFQGLMLSERLPADHALLIPRCRSVHTCFMRYALDLVYLNRRNEVVKLVPGLRPWRVSWGSNAAVQVVEMGAGGIDRHAIALGDTLVVSQSKEKHRATQAA